MKKIIPFVIVLLAFCSNTSGQSESNDTLVVDGKIIYHIKSEAGEVLFCENRAYSIVLTNQTINQNDWKFVRGKLAIRNGRLLSTNESEFKIQVVPIVKKFDEKEIEKEKNKERLLLDDNH